MNLYALGAALLVVVGGTWFYGHTRYDAGYEAAVAVYQPRIDAANTAKSAADARVEVSERVAKATTDKLVSDYEQDAKDRNDALAGVQQRLASVLRQHRTDAARSCQAGGVPNTPEPGAAPGEQRDERLAERLAGVGGRCEHDAAEVRLWLDWYAAQKAIYDAGGDIAPR